MSDTLSIGVVTYNHGHLLERTLVSLLQNLPDAIPTRVLVLDNRSSDDSLAVAQRIAAADPRVSAIESWRNEGFGAGNNRILAAVDSTYHVFCNPDVRITQGALDALIGFLRTHQDVGIVCPRVHFDDGRLQPLNKRDATLWDLFLRRFMPRRWRPRFEERMRRYEMLDEGYDDSYDVPFPSGAFMVCRTHVIKSIGGFDARFFLYMEDADLARQVRRVGWRTVYFPHAIVVHDWQREAHRSYRGTFLFCASVVRYFNKWGWRLS